MDVTVYSLSNTVKIIWLFYEKKIKKSIVSKRNTVIDKTTLEISKLCLLYIHYNLAIIGAKLNVL